MSSILSAWLLYLARENFSLRTALQSALAGLDASSTACILPEVHANTLTGASLSLKFPRQRPTLILSIQRGCAYCNSALNTWPNLLRSIPTVDGIVYEGGGPYSSFELENSGIHPSSVITSSLTTLPYSELLRPTPTVMLIGRSGRVLGRWTGELSGAQALLIEIRIHTLLM